MAKWAIRTDQVLLSDDVIKGAWTKRIRKGRVRPQALRSGVVE
jgi:hypothetical protein